VIRQRRLILALVLLAAALQASPAMAKRPSKPEDRAKAVRLAKELELDPMSDDSLEKRKWLVKWYEKVPDITVTICDVFGPLPPDEHPFFPFVLVQSMFSQGAFIIEHPDQSNDKVAAQMAGMLGSLKVYEVFIKERPDAALPYFDDMLKRREEGRLATYMAEAVATGCK
jgi:hypothetical protein